MNGVVTSASGICYEPFEPGIQARSIELYQRLRDEAPVYRTDAGYWAVSRYADVKEIFRHPERFSSKANQSEGLGLDMDLAADADPAMLENLMRVASGMTVDLGELFSAEALVAADPPHHTRLRRIVNRGFVPRRIAQLEGQVQTAVDECLAGIETADEYEVVSRLAVPLPVRTIADLLSVDPADYRRVKDWTIQLGEVQGPLRGTPEVLAVVVDMFKSFSDYFVPRIDARKAEPRDDLISDLVRAAESDILTTAESLLFIFQLMAAGNETTTSAITNMVLALKRNPEQYELLMQRPELLPNAIEEIVRYRPPLQVLFRTALVDAELSGVSIPAGSTIALLVGAANLDPRQFDEPDRFDITRDTSSMIGFGFGIHNCIGAHLARSEMRLAMSGLLPHLSRFELADEPLTYRPSYMMYNLEQVRLLAPASRLAPTG